MSVKFIKCYSWFIKNKSFSRGNYLLIKGNEKESPHCHVIENNREVGRIFIKGKELNLIIDDIDNFKYYNELRKSKYKYEIYTFIKILYPLRNK